MTDEFPSFRSMEHTARTESLYNMHKKIESFIKSDYDPSLESPTISEGYYESPFDVRNETESEAYPYRWRPTDLDLSYKREGGAKRYFDPDFEPGVGTPSKEDNDRAVRNINNNNESLGLKDKTPLEKEMLPSADGKSTPLGNSIIGNRNANDMANRFIEGN